MRGIRLPLLLTAGLLAAACSSSSWAQDPVQDALTTTMRDEVDSKMIDPSLSSPTTSGVPQITLSSSEKDSKAIAEIGYAVAEKWNVLLKVVAPVEKGQDEVELANLDGLTAGSSATLGFSRLFWKLDDEYIERIGGVCELYNEQLPEAYPKAISTDPGSCTPKALREKGWPWDEKADFVVSDALETTCEEFNAAEIGIPILTCDLETLRARGTEWEQKATDRIVSDLGSVCHEYNARKLKTIDPDNGECTYLALKSRGEHWGTLARRTAQFKVPRILTFKVTAQSDSFKYLEGDDLVETKDRKEGYGASLSYGWLLRSGYYGINLKWQEFHKAKKKTEVCQPIEGTDALSCRNIALEAPSQVQKEILQLETRRFFGKHFGINPRLSHDLEADETSAQLVTYFLTDKDKGLNGGIDLAYKDGGEEDGFSVRLFIGSAFKLTP